MKKLIVFLTFIIASASTNAQDLEYMFQAKNDATTYIQHYMAPGMNGLMYNLNNGWYSTGKTHNVLGFDLTVTASAAMIPASETTFTFDPSEYGDDFGLVGGGSAELPTVAGGTTTEQLEITYGSDSVVIDAVDGVGEEWKENIPIDMPVSIPTPMVQVGIGLPSKTDIKLRYFPDSETDGVKYGLLGVGVQHNISQYIKALDSVPRVTFSALGAFTKAHTSYVPTNDTGDVVMNNERIEMNINAYTFQLIGDYDLKFINFYLGLGYTAGKTTLGAYGTYKYDTNENGTFEEDEIVKDPINLEFTITGFRTTAGARINLGPIKIFGDYTYQKYPSVSAGFALSFN